MSHTVRSERTSRLPACYYYFLFIIIIVNIIVIIMAGKTPDA